MIAGLAACRIEASQHGGPLHWPVVLKWLSSAGKFGGKVWRDS